MGSPLPHISSDRFRRELLEAGPSLGEPPLHREIDRLCDTLYRHYDELRRWNPRLSLVGPGTTGEIVARHYGESLAALPLLRDSDQTLVDVGSGGGFPGLVLAAAAPRLEVTLVEARERKCQFLRSAIRICRLSCRCLNARVDRSPPVGLPARIDLVTCRAVAVSDRFFRLFHRHSPRARFLVWQGLETPGLPDGLRILREISLAGSDHRRILEIGAAGSDAPEGGGPGIDTAGIDTAGIDTAGIDTARIDTAGIDRAE